MRVDKLYQGEYGDQDVVHFSIQNCQYHNYEIKHKAPTLELEHIQSNFIFNWKDILS